MNPGQPRFRPCAIAAAALTLCLFFPGNASARVKLITLPPRERVEVRLGTGEDAPTLIEEERIVPLVKADWSDPPNEIDFSWTNTRIDPGSIVLRILGPAPGPENEGLDVSVRSATFPPGGNSLVWQVFANKSGSVRVSIAYLIDGLNTETSYRFTAAHDEQTICLQRYILLHNLSNEEFLSTLEGASGSTIYVADFYPFMQWPAGTVFRRPIGFQETKRLLVETVGEVPLTREYRCEPEGEDAWLDEADSRLKVRMGYLLRNDEASGLGRSPLPAGKVRTYINHTPSDVKAPPQITFLGEDEIGRTLLNEPLRLTVGLAQDIVVRRFIEKDDSAHVTGNLFDKTVCVRYEIENYKETPVELQIVEDMEALEGYDIDTKRANWRDGLKTAWKLAPDSELGAPDPEHSSADKALFRIALPAREKDGQPVKIVKRLRIRFPGQYVE